MNYPSAEFECVVAAMCHGTASQEQVSQLAELLRRDESARDAYLFAVELHARLASENGPFISPAALPGNAIPSMDNRRLPLRSRALWFAAAAAVVLLCLAGWWFGLGGRGFTSGPNVAIQILDTQGTMSGAWAAGQSVSLDTLRLDSGMLRFRLEQSGVILTAASPVEVKFVDPMRIRVVRGQVTADVGQRGKGFVVETAQGEFVDLGTTFGIDAAAGDATDLVVFKGSVQIYRDARRITPVSTLAEGEAVRVGKDTSMSRIPNIISTPPMGGWSTSPPKSELCVIESARDNLRNPDDKVFYQIVPHGLKENAPAYVGPGHIWKGRTANGLPSYLVGADVVRTFPNDQGRRNLQITVRISRPAVLYVLFETRPQQWQWRETPNMPLAPEWLLRDFHKTGDAVGLDDAGQLRPGEMMSLSPGQGHLVTFDVWKREFREPGEVTLGAPTGPEGWKNWMYGIAARPLETK